MTGHPLPLPAVDEVTADWWAATRDRRLLVQRCTACAAAQHYPRALCTACGGTDLAFEPASGRGVVHSATAVHRGPHPDLVTPYAVALVDLAEGPRLLTRVVDPDAAVQADGTRPPPHPGDAAALIDRPVAIDWWPLPDGRALPVFRLV